MICPIKMEAMIIAENNSTIAQNKERIDAMQVLINNRSSPKIPARRTTRNTFVSRTKRKTRATLRFGILSDGSGSTPKSIQATITANRSRRFHPLLKAQMPSAQTRSRSSSENTSANANAEAEKIWDTESQNARDCCSPTPNSSPIASPSNSSANAITQALTTIKAPKPRSNLGSPTIRCIQFFFCMSSKPDADKSADGAEIGNGSRRFVDATTFAGHPSSVFTSVVGWHTTPCFPGLATATACRLIWLRNSFISSSCNVTRSSNDRL
mmetsp:Transcript_36741/g.88320  ORF Transcript_36741/g.88320 Transcript_36741/m.88320 type:complete len:268 (+) Transcript_36741:758-1561(+)